MWAGGRMEIYMRGFVTMLKVNIKLLLRNKGYLAFLIILPLVSVGMLNVKHLYGVEGEKSAYAIQEIKDDNKSYIDMLDAKLRIKVYDCSGSDISDYLLKKLASSGSYRIYRYRTNTLSLGEARKRAATSANKSIIGAVIYIPASFEDKLLSENQSNLTLFKATKDARINILKKNLDSELQSLEGYAKASGKNKITLEKILKTAAKNEMNKKIVKIKVGDNIELTSKQQSKKSSIGYSLAFLTIGFLFSGIFIAATIIDERQNRVFNRILMSKTSLIIYGQVKMILIFLTVAIQTGILAAAVKLFVKTDFGIPYGSYLFFVFCLGIIFDLLSVVTGILTNNVLSSNYIAFTIWSLSCLIAGLYFPLDSTSKFWANASKLMPQNWTIKAAEMLMTGRRGAYSMYTLVIIGYIIVIMSAGYIGIKLKRK